MVRASFMLHHKVINIVWLTGPTAKTVLNTSPCIAFRVVGSPIKTTSSEFLTISDEMFITAHFFTRADVTEVQFALEPTGKDKDPLSTNEYAVIAITSFCLGLMYIASVFLYIYLKKKKDQPSNANSEDLSKNFSREGEKKLIALILS